MTIHAMLSQQHRDCDQLFERCQHALQQQDWNTAEQAFGQLHRDLTAHIELEETQLFPAFEQATGQTQGPTTVMRHEHEWMQGRLARIPAALQQRHANEALQLLGEVTELLAQHNRKEERVLYPWCDQLLPELAEQLATQA